MWRAVLPGRAGHLLEAGQCACRAGSGAWESMVGSCTRVVHTLDGPPLTHCATWNTLLDVGHHFKFLIITRTLEKSECFEIVLTPSIAIKYIYMKMDGLATELSLL